MQAVDVIVVGAGFAGMYSVYKLREDGFSVQGFEAGDDVGGTWYWNRYPGARCDIESMEYSYQFSKDLEQEWNWKERYAPQPEILSYANHVADKFNLRPHYQFETRVVRAVFNEADNLWYVTTDRGEEFSARWCIMATGCLSSTNLPDFRGLESFKGKWYHTGLWPKEGVDFTGKRVAVIGTGSSAIQSIPQIAKQAEHLTVFQRTANFSIPAHNGPLSEAFVKQIKEDYPAFRKLNSQESGGFGGTWTYYDDNAVDADEVARQKRFETRWNEGGFRFLSAFADLGTDEAANQMAADFVRDKIRGIVKDPATAELLCPDQVLGCKRLCVDIDYFETYNRDNVSLVSVKDQPIECVTEQGLRVGEQDYEFDVLVFATGFDAMTGSLLKIDIEGRDGLTLQTAWEAGPKTYLGLQVHGFPNLFTVSGPGSPSVLSNMIVTIEQHVNWITRCIAHMRFSGFNYVEAQEDAQETWVAHCNDLSKDTFYPTCNSWYLGANVPGKPRIFMPYVGGLPAYAEKCEAVASRSYEGFEMK